ncbi:hypothetical protein EKK58_06675 [Candidatus Dependentiae bacterium]|nr:MAG: hypothetical protein EKK58_06675 [Candidatus Dependentiae bacterium]
MELLIDGYNLFKQIAGVQFLSSVQIKSYVETLFKYAEKKNLQTLLIFDGGLSSYPMHQQHGLLHIVYVGKHKTADDAIKQTIEEQAGKDILLVSSDRELNRIADYYNIASIDVHDFWEFVRCAFQVQKKTMQKVGATIKTSRGSNPELDALMMCTKLTPVKDDEEVEVTVCQWLKKSKIDKKLLQKIKKL